jgi:endoglucanase
MMTQLKELCALDGVSGREEAVREYILHCLAKSSADLDVKVDALGNVLVSVRGKRRAARKLLFAAHMDEVGLMIVGATDDGFLRFAKTGGIDDAVLYGRCVKVNGHYGIIGGKAVHQCKGDDKRTIVATDKLLIDVGVGSREEALTIAEPGDVAVFDSDFVKLEDGLFKARALDDRAGCALLLELASKTPEYDIYVAFTVQEEVGLRGAKTAAFGMEPDVAVVVDSTTAADTVGVSGDKRVCRVGGGPVVSFMDNRTLYDRALYQQIFKIAERIDSPVQTKTMVAGGNDAGAIQLSRTGVRVAAVSLPCRYIHSPSCVLSKKDLNSTAVLLKELATELAKPKCEKTEDTL